MARVFLSLGSNLGDRRRYLEDALDWLREEGTLRVIACSHVYETAPWPEAGPARQPWYLNCAVEIETDLAPWRLLRLTQTMETRSGRVRPESPPTRTAAPPAPYAPRPLDIDILLYGDEVIAEDRLQIPHPFLHLRRFVLVPLADIAGQVEHPTLYQSIADLLDELPGEGDVRPFPA